VLAVAGVVAWLVQPQDIHAVRLLNKRPLEASLATPGFQSLHHRGQLAASNRPVARAARDTTPAPAR